MWPAVCARCGESCPTCSHATSKPRQQQGIQRQSGILSGAQVPHLQKACCSACSKRWPPAAAMPHSAGVSGSLPLGFRVVQIRGHGPSMRRAHGAPVAHGMHQTCAVQCCAARVHACMRACRRARRTSGQACRPWRASVELGRSGPTWPSHALGDARSTRAAVPNTDVGFQMDGGGGSGFSGLHARHTRASCCTGSYCIMPHATCWHKVVRAVLPSLKQAPLPG